MQLLAVLSIPTKDEIGEHESALDEEHSEKIKNSAFLEALSELCQITNKRFMNFEHIAFWMGIRAFWMLSKDIRVSEIVAQRGEWLGS
tara:strand:- start:12 stop:275 length:264 start_codon:yes stop_codon:yes gene_type:complete